MSEVVLVFWKWDLMFEGDDGGYGFFFFYMCFLKLLGGGLRVFVFKLV